VPDGAGTYAGNIRNFLELVHSVCGDMVVVCGKALDRVMPPIGTNDLTRTAAYGSRARPQTMMDDGGKGCKLPGVSSLGIKVVPELLIGPQLSDVTRKRSRL
jgi:hypothetical protein